MKVLNLDKIVTKRDTVIILGGKEHVMRVPTVKDYIDQMKTAEQINALTSEENQTLEVASKILEITIDTLLKSFPSVTRKQFESLNMEQLQALRQLADDAADKDAESEGEAKGETE